MLTLRFDAPDASRWEQSRETRNEARPSPLFFLTAACGLRRRSTKKNKQGMGASVIGEVRDCSHRLALTGALEAASRRRAEQGFVVLGQQTTPAFAS
jgi:hypothetical protein